MKRQSTGACIAQACLNGTRFPLGYRQQLSIARRDPHFWSKMTCQECNLLEINGHNTTEKCEGVSGLLWDIWVILNIIGLIHVGNYIGIR